MDGIETSRTITDVSPRVPDGDYTMTVEGEVSPSRWRRGRDVEDDGELWPVNPMTISSLMTPSTPVLFLITSLRGGLR
jgi:hypothetical protein